MMTRLLPFRRPALFVSIVAFLAGASMLQAQECEMTFGPPLRANMLFAYKYTERVNAVYEAPGDNGPIRDSSERLLTYFITQRQIPAPDNKDLLLIEANIDSMHLEYRSADDSISFDSQKQVESYIDVSHRELLVPTALVNRMVTFTISPYGEVLKIEGPILDIRDQAAAPQIDQFTRDRVTALTRDEYLTNIFFPWRGVAPLGQRVVCGKSVAKKAGIVLDRTPYSDIVLSTFQLQGEKRQLSYQGKYAHPTVETLTINSFADPLKIVSSEGKISGGLELDQDGVVSEGWSASNGTIVATVDRMKVNGTISHEVYFSRMWISPFAQNPAN